MVFHYIAWITTQPYSIIKLHFYWSSVYYSIKSTYFNAIHPLISYKVTPFTPEPTRCTMLANYNSSIWTIFLIYLIAT